VLHNSENQTVPRRLFKPKTKGFPDKLCSTYDYITLLRCCPRQNKTLITLTDKNTAETGSKTAFRKGAENSFCLWQKLRNLNQKIAHAGEDLDFYSEMARFYEFARTHFATKCE